MPLIDQNTQLAIKSAVNDMLEETGVLPARDKFTAYLEESGITIETLARILATLLTSGKESIRLKALQMALSSYGIDLAPKVQENSNQVVVQINVAGNLGNQLFSPERKY